MLRGNKKNTATSARERGKESGRGRKEREERETRKSEVSLSFASRSFGAIMAPTPDACQLVNCRIRLAYPCPAALHQARALFRFAFLSRPPFYFGALVYTRKKTARIAAIRRRPARLCARVGYFLKMAPFFQCCFMSCARLVMFRHSFGRLQRAARRYLNLLLAFYIFQKMHMLELCFIMYSFYFNNTPSII